MKHIETINSRIWARAARRKCRVRLLGPAYKHPRYEFVSRWVATIPNLGTLSARPCYRYAHGADYRRVELTGGWKIEARPANAGHLSLNEARWLVRYVPGPVDLDKLARYMGTLERQLRSLAAVHG